MSFPFLIFYIVFNYNGYGIIICDTNTSCSDMIACNVSDICEINCYNEACAGKSIIVNNVDIVNITCNGLRSCQDMILNVNLTDEGIFNMDCNGKESCRNIDGTIISGNKGSISCFDSESCMDMSIIGVGLNGLNLYCDGDLACKSGLITLTTLNSELNNTELNINCNNGEKVCQDLEANGISIDNANVICHYSVHENECSGIQVYCPVNPNNINNSCSIDFNGAGDTSKIYAIYGVSQTFIENTNNDNIQLYCGFDWFYVLDFNKSVMGSSTSFCDDQESIQNNITNRIVNNDVILILYPNSNQILCDANHDCLIFILPNQNPINNVLCPIGSHFCSLYYSGSALSNAIIDGSGSKTLSIHSKTGLTTMNSTINCPTNIHSECRIIVDNPKIIDTYIYKTTINADNTETLNISGYGDQSLSNAVIKAQNANTVYLECIGEQSCKELSIYMYHEMLQDIFNSRLFINCIGTESCLNTKVTIESKYNISTCLSHTNNEWRCSHINKNITVTTTLAPNTTLPLNTTLALNTLTNNTISTAKDTGNSFTMFFRQYWLWIITAVVAFLCIGVCLCVIGTGCVYQYRKRELEPEITRSTIFSSTGTQSHNNCKSDSEIQTDRSTTIIYNGNYNNRNIIHTRNYNTSGRSTHLTVNPAVPNRNYLDIDRNDTLNLAAQVPLSPTQNNSKTDTIIPGTAIDGMNLMTTLDFAAQVPLSPTNKSPNGSPNERSNINPNIPRFNEHSKSNDFSFEYSKPKKFNPTNGEPSPSISSKRIKSEGIVTPKVLHNQIGKYVNNTKDIIMEEPHIINNSHYDNDDNVEIISDLNV